MRVKKGEQEVERREVEKKAILKDVEGLNAKIGDLNKQNRELEKMLKESSSKDTDLQEKQ